MGGADAGQGVVVTGAARGIGRAIAQRYAADGARVVVNDLDPDATRAVADEIGGYAAPGDAASADGVAALVEAARGHLGEIDTYVANAGILHGLWLDATDEEWARSLEVNVMAHVRAARLLVPGWAERGSGRFVVTASAAGLLTALGSATYSATKHAAVGFAEWLAATYAHRGVHVHAICPQGVTTQMLEDAGEMADLLVADGARTPEDVAEALMAAVADDRFLVLPHPEVARYYAHRAGDTDRWLGGMNKLQQMIEERTR
jgi:NAD(P)-dependent dehydrogenase (short-subunit alcohol dehydrogenase family)